MSVDIQPLDHDVLVEGNSARDQKNWSMAAQFFRQHVKQKPDDVAIWIQLAHVEKEQKNFVAAESAYLHAIDLDPHDVDPRLHLAHMLKIIGRQSEALAHFRHIMSVTPRRDVSAEIELIERVDLDVNLRNDCSFFEVRDLFQYLDQHLTVTGISRVVLAIIEYALNALPPEKSEYCQFVHQLGDGDGLSLISKLYLRRMLDLALADVLDHAAMKQVIAEARQAAPRVELEPGATYFIPGAFWDAASNSNFLPTLKRGGVRIGAYLYDLIPITHAHYCMAGLTQGFNIAFSETVPFYDFALTISKFVSEEVKGFLDRYDLRSFPVFPVPLAHEVTIEGQARSKRRPSARVIGEVRGREFILCVCTIEARKNHSYLFYIWQQMIRDGIDAPDLVFVGRQGWRVNDLYEQMAASDYLDGRLHVLSGLPDADLEHLYKECLFTVFPSFVEGWGLPVGESLAHGKVCVASSTSSIPEVAGDLVTYVDPFNQASGYETISGLILDRARLRTLEDRIAAEFEARTWRQVGSDFYAALERIAASLPAAVERQDVYVPRLSSGQMLELTELDGWTMRRPEYVRNPQRLAFAEGWGRVAADGVRMKGQEAAIEFQSDCEPGRPVQILLLIGTSPSVTPETLLSVLGGKERQDRGGPRSNVRRALQPNQQFWLKVPTDVMPSGRVSIRFKLDGRLPSEMLDAASEYAFKVHAVGYAAVDDTAARLQLMERASLGV